MGYMGFGMQSWIYSRRPRKPFDAPNLKCCNTLPSYNRNFAIKPSGDDSDLIGLISLIIAMTLIIFTLLSYNGYISYSKNINEEIRSIERLENREAFYFLIKSGEGRLENNRIYDAYSEFKLAISLFPNNNRANKLYLETLSILCKDNNDYCKEMDIYLSKTNTL